MKPPRWPAAGPLVLRGGRVWRGDPRAEGQRLDLLVDGGRIVQVGLVSKVPRDASVIDLDGRWVIPGLIDMHVHLTWAGGPDPSATVQAEGEQCLTAMRTIANAERELRAGITTVRDLGGYWDLAIAAARAVEAGIAEGPTIVAAGRTVIMTGGHDPFWGIEADGPTAVVSAVRRQVSRGAGVIKMCATGGVYGRADGEAIGQTEMTYEEMAAGIAEAHRLGVRVAAHALGSEGILNAVRAGVDTIEHGTFLTEEILAEMTRRGTALCPTLRIYRTIAENRDGRIPEYAVAKSRTAVEAHRQSFEMARSAGIAIVAGTDAGSCLTPHPALVAEIVQLHEYGMTTGEALAAATSTAATVLGRDETVGSIEAGREADILVLDADPLADLAALECPTAVLRRGRIRAVAGPMSTRA